MSSQVRHRLVIVDDDPDDVYIIRRAIAQADLPVEVALLPDGQAFVDFYAAGAAPAQPRQIVLLDINMPVLTGFDALRTLGEIGAPRHTPIVMFSTSAEPDDVARAYGLGVNGYVKKPGTIEEATALVVALDAYWLKSNIAAA
jgi:CheY-like chemotaxis protein